MINADYLPTPVLLHKFIHVLVRIFPEAHNVLPCRHKILNDSSQELFSTVLEGLSRDSLRFRRLLAEYCLCPKQTLFI